MFDSWGVVTGLAGFVLGVISTHLYLRKSSKRQLEKKDAELRQERSDHAATKERYKSSVELAKERTRVANKNAEAYQNKREKLRHARDSLDALRRELDDEKAAGGDRVVQLETTLAELTRINEELRTEISEKDDELEMSGLLIQDLDAEVEEYQQREAESPQTRPGGEEDRP